MLERFRHVNAKVHPVNLLWFILPF